MFSLASFFISAFIIVGFFVLRHFEITQNKKYFVEHREKLDKLSHDAYKYITKTFPVIFSKNARHASIHIIDLLSSYLLIGVRLIEKKLHSFANIIKGRKEVQAGEPSSFFKDVFEHKNKAGKDR